MKNNYKIFLFLFFLELLSNISFAQKPKYNDRILVIGGGGIRGAWGGGFAKHLTDSLGVYKIIYGTSTGSLLAPLIVLDSFEKLKEAYTSVNQKSIFNKNPFNKKNGKLKGLYCLFRILTGKESFGRTDNLRKLMDKFLTPEDYKRITNSPDSLMYTVTAVDMKNGQLVHACSKDHKDHNKMKDWMWASANEPLFMNYVYISDDESTLRHNKNKKRNDNDIPYVDGGVISNVPLLEAVNYAKHHPEIKAIDVIINKPENALAGTEFKKRSIFRGLLRLIELWSVQIRNDNIMIGKLQAISSNAKENNKSFATTTGAGIEVNLFFYPEHMFVGSNSIYQKELLLNKKRMETIWNLGELGVRDPVNEASKQNRQLLVPFNDEELNMLIEENTPVMK